MMSSQPGPKKITGDPESEAVERMVATVPQTLHGAAAMLACMRGHFGQGYPMCEENSTMVLLGSVECAVCRAAGLPVPSPVGRISAA